MSEEKKDGGGNKFVQSITKVGTELVRGAINGGKWGAYCASWMPGPAKTGAYFFFVPIGTVLGVVRAIVPSVIAGVKQLLSSPTSGKQ